MDDHQEGQTHQTRGLHSISVIKEAGIVEGITWSSGIVPGLDQVDQRGDDGPGGVEGESIQNEPVDNPPGEQILVTPEHVGGGGDVPGQDGGGGHVGDGYEEQPSRGESQQPSVPD